MAHPEYGLGPAGRADYLRERLIRERIGCEQLLNQLTPEHHRNPSSTHIQILRHGYAIHDGPAQDTQS